MSCMPKLFVIFSCVFCVCPVVACISAVKIFIYKDLNIIIIKRQQGSVKFDRAAIEQQARADYLRRMTQEAQVKNVVDAQCASQRTRTWKRASVADNLRSVRLCGNKATAAGKAYWQKNKRGVITTGACLGLCALSLPLGVAAFAIRAGWRATTSTVKNTTKR